MSETQFGNALGVFYISYVVFQLPSNVVLERLHPRRWIAFIAIIWGYIIICIYSIFPFYLSLVAT